MNSRLERLFENWNYKLKKSKLLENFPSSHADNLILFIYLHLIVLNGIIALNSIVEKVNLFNFMQAMDKLDKKFRGTTSR